MTDTVNVPREPTEAMIEAGVQAVMSFGRVSNGVCNAYRSMLASAPKAEPDWNYEGAMADLDSAITVLIRRINGEADLASAAEWVRLNYPSRASEIVAQPEVAQEPVGAAEVEVGRAVYMRVEQLVALNPKPNTSEWSELTYLSHLTDCVEELGAFDGPSTALFAPAPASDELLEAGRKALMFFEAVRNAFWSDDASQIDGSDFEGWAEKHGLIEPCAYDPDRDGPNQWGLTKGDPWFTTTPDVVRAIAQHKGPQS